MDQVSDIQDGRAALCQSDLARAFEVAVSVLRRSPSDGDGWWLLADTMRASGRPAQAIEHYVKAARFLPDPTHAWRSIAKLAAQLKQSKASIDAWAEVVQRNPTDTDLLIEAAQATNTLGGIRQSIIWLEQVLAHDPDNIQAHLKLGFTRENRAEYAQAELHFNHVLQAMPGHASATVGLARIALHLRKLPAARSLLEGCMRAGAPSFATIVTYAELCKAEGRAGDAIPMLEGAVRSGEQLQPKLRQILLHRYGDALHAKARHQDAFEAYAQANSLATQSDAGIGGYVDRLIASFQDVVFDAAQPTAQAERLLFIVGMPRSGSSLIEQIVSAHPDVHGCGELEALKDLTRRAEREGLYPEGNLGKAEVQQLQMQYLSALPEVPHKRITDKMPRNVLFLGMLARIFPGARVIVTRRDPIDTCWSCFRQHFGDGLTHTTSLKAIGQYHRDIDRLLDFWMSKLPLRFLEVKYEDLVRSPEPQMRRMIEFAGLSWDPSCLNFHTSGRRVATISRGQADRPLYTGGIGNAQPYHPYLSDLFEVLSLPQGG